MGDSNDDAGPAAAGPEALPAWTERAALVYGARKAGTTLLLNLLDGGAALAFPVEIKLKALHRMTPGAGARAAYLQQSRVARLEANGLSLDRYRALWSRAPEAAGGDDLRTLLRRDALHLALSAPADAARDGVPPVAWVAKDVGGDTDAIVGAWLRMFPGGTVLMLVRDPRMTTRAVLRERRRKGVRMTLRRIIHETADPLRVVARQAAYLGERRVCFVAYERLVADTAGEMRRIGDALSIPYAQALTVPSIFGAPVVVATSSRPVQGVFRSDARWSDGLTRRERLVVGLTHALLSRLPGYRCDYPALLRRIARRSG